MEQSNRNLNSYNTKDEDSHTFCLSSLPSFAWLKILIASLICTKVIDFVSLSNERKGSFV